MHKTIFQEKSLILAKQKLAKDFFGLRLSSHKIAANAKPGQFVEVRVKNSFLPLLRRPLGVHQVGRNNFELLFQVVGPGTQILSQKNLGDYLDVIGPLGNGFDFQLPRRKVLVAGGMGVVPLLFLAQKLTECQVSSAKYRTTVLIGAKNKAQIICARDFKKFGCEVLIATDDGSKGFKGKVTDLLKKFLRGTSNRLDGTIYSCGPKLMLKEVAKLSQDFNIPAQISLEEHMACGIGACLGCAVETKQGFKRVCKEGPVFNAEEIIW
ncbi:MAG: dihydroorotate dehydrogenase electron transfer subunit [Candidatus Omnitrophica bacterium]|nr:dihydroorotate dehydrogenase electron transfer subunit [Candidatus Omnitrophota bacterium]